MCSCNLLRDFLSFFIFFCSIAEYGKHQTSCNAAKIYLKKIFTKFRSWLVVKPNLYNIASDTKW